MKVAELLETIGVEGASSRSTAETAAVRGASRVARETGAGANQTRPCRRLPTRSCIPVSSSLSRLSLSCHGELPITKFPECLSMPRVFLPRCGAAKALFKASARCHPKCGA
jgi:hypothetical protein